MADLEKLKAAITDRGVKKGVLAEKIGVDPNTFSRKLNGSNDFKLREVQIIASELHLTKDEAVTIFFA